MGFRPVMVQPSCCKLAAIISAAFQVLPVRLSTKSATFILRFNHAEWGHEKIPGEDSGQLWSEFFERGPRQQQMLAALFAEIDDGLGFVTRTGDIDDDSFTKDRVFNHVTNPQSDFLTV